MVFASRTDAGVQLAEHLRQEGVRPDVVLGLPRGGVVVAAAVARTLHVPLGVIVVRKIGHPRQREFAVGALAEPNVVLLNRQAIAATRVSDAELAAVIAEEQQRLREYQRKFESPEARHLAGKSVAIVDDGLATGATMQAAVQSARQQQAREIIVAVPVASDTAYARLAEMADRVYALVVDPEFDAVGRYYDEFTQTTDEEVVALLREHREHVHS